MVGGVRQMKKLFLAIVVVAIIAAAVKYLPPMLTGKKSVRVLEVNRYYSSGSSDELVAVVQNTGKGNATVRGGEVHSQVNGRWASAPKGDTEVKLEPGETQNISLGSIPNAAQKFRVKIYVITDAGSQYTVTW